jgi:eukaryotic-like serine/threonine-protein kinase
MSRPDPVGKPSPTGEATALYQHPPAEQAARTGRTHVALVRGAGPQPVEEIQRLLRKRLRYFALVISGGIVVLLLVVFLPALFRAETNVPGIVITFGVYGAEAGLAVVAAWILWSRRPLSLGQLRVIEVIVFGTMVASGVWMHYDFFVPFWAPNPPVESLYPLGYPLLLAAGESLPWVFLIMVYGTFIPNTWRRCAAFVGIMAVIPWVLTAASAITGAAMGTRPLLNFLDFLTFMGMWLAFAVAVAVYGSYRIGLLRQEALEARKLGQYQLKQRLGAGGMGEVYLAEHVLLRRPCAAKLIRPERAGDPKHLLRFEREVRTTATLTHPNTVQIYDYGHSEDGTFYYVMEYLPGLTLEQLVKQYGPLPPGRAIHFLRQLCGALQEAHGIGLIHRDIKPGNVMVCQRGGLHDTAKLLDFGLVLPPAGDPDGEKLTQEGAVAGTPAYMSPEQAGGQENVDARSDIYSVGALAYFLLAGQPPFAGRSSVKMLAAHLYELPAPLTQRRPDVPGDLQAVVLRCLAKEPAGRYADAESLETALAGCHTAGAWSAMQAASWWRCQAGTNEIGGFQGVNEVRDRTSR